MKLTDAQQRILDAATVSGHAVFDGTQRRPIEALVKLGLVTATKEWVSYRYKWRYVVKPVLKHVGGCYCDEYASDARCVDLRRALREQEQQP